MPTTVNQSGVRSPLSRKRRPIGSASPHARFAIVWLISATGLFVGALAVGQVAAAHQRDAERLPQVRRRGDEADARLLPRLDRLAFDDHVAAAAAAAERHEVRGERRLHAGQRLDAPHDVLDPARLRVVRLVGLARQIEAHRHQRRGVEPDARPLQVEEAADEERRADQQDQREADLRDDQRVAQPGAALAGRAAAALAEALLQAGAGRLQRRNDAEEDAGADRDRDGVGQRAGVEAPVNEVGNAVGRDRAGRAAAARPTRPRSRAAR